MVKLPALRAHALLTNFADYQISAYVQARCTVSTPLCWTLSSAPKMYLCPRFSLFIASVGKLSTLPVRIASIVIAHYWHHVILPTRLPSSMYVYDVHFAHRRGVGCKHETWLCSLRRFSYSIWTVSLLRARTDLNLHYVKRYFLMPIQDWIN
jgi:hypothetical protein